MWNIKKSWCEGKLYNFIFMTFSGLRCQEFWFYQCASYNNNNNNHLYYFFAWFAFHLGFFAVLDSSIWDFEATWHYYIWMGSVRCDMLLWWSEIAQQPPNGLRVWIIHLCFMLYATVVMLLPTYIFLF